MPSTKFLTALLFLSISANICFAQDSLIARVLEAKESIVHIRALRTEIFKNPKASAAVDPRKKRLFIANTAKKIQYENKGAGVILSADGLIVTNLHTLKGANKVAVTLYNQDTYSAKIVHLMPKHDLALIKIFPRSALRPIAFEDSNTVSLKDTVINIGSSDLLNGTITQGKVNGIGTSRAGGTGGNTVELIQVNMDIYRGDSGGPLLNSRGRLVGMMAAKLSSEAKKSLAIPSNKIKKLYLHFIKSYNKSL